MVLYHKIGSARTALPLPVGRQVPAGRAVDSLERVCYNENTQIILFLMSGDRPQIGVAVFVIKDGKILMLKRIGAHGADTWSLPGGHLEYGEEPEDAAAREAEEELGIKIKNIRPAPYTNDIFEKEGRHYITLFFVADFDSGEPVIKELDRIECFDWFEWDQMPRPLFLPIENLLQQGFDPFGDEK